LNYSFLKNFNVVYIAESVSDYHSPNLINTGFEQESKEDTTRILKILKEYFNKVYYYSSPQLFVENIEKHTNDIVFPNWFGRDSRNRKGYIPSICESCKIKYVGADSHAHIICSDKYVSKLYAKEYGLKASNGIIINPIDHKIELKLRSLNLPLIVKPNFEGSSVGISDESIFYDYNEAQKQIQYLSENLREQIIIEEYLDGYEVKVFIFGNTSKIHIVDQQLLMIGDQDYFTNQVFGFECKKMNRSYKNISTQIVNQSDLNSMIQIFNSFKKVEYLRIDGRVKDGIFRLIELSPDCTISEKSGFRDVYSNVGLSYEEAILSLIVNSIFPDQYQMTNML